MNAAGTENGQERGGRTGERVSSRELKQVELSKLIAAVSNAG